MLKKGLLTLSIGSWVLLVCFMTYIIAMKRSKTEIMEDLFCDNGPIEQREVYPKTFTIPYKSYVQSEGIVVPATGYIKITNPIEGVVEKVFVGLGEMVTENAPLFKIKDNAIYVEIKECEARLDKSIAQLEFRRKGPSTYALLSKQKEIEEIALKKSGQEKEAQIFQTLLEKTAVSSIETDEKNLFLQITEKSLEKAQAEYDDLKADMSSEEEDIYLHEIEEKKAALKLSALKLESSLVKSPMIARVAKISVAEGEFLSSKGLCGVTLVKEHPSMIKVSVSEEEAYKIKRGEALKAIAIHPDNPNLYFVLDYVSYSPKMSIYKNGERSLELYFSFHKDNIPVYLEQSLIVFIEATNPLNLSFLHHKFGY